MMWLLGCAWVGDLEARLDYDGDGFVSVTFGGEDCDDADASVNPDADEVCGNALDEDCDGVARVESTWYRDADGDGWGQSQVIACDPPDASYIDRGGDCDDSDATLNPETSWRVDYDGDGWGGDVLSVGCEGEGVVQGGDCDDTKSWVNPGIEADQCDDEDSDCDGQVDEDGTLYWPDADYDQFGDDGAQRDQLCEGAYRPYDCDDDDADTNPRAQDCSKRCSTLSQECAAEDGVVVFAIEAHTTWPTAQGVVVGDTSQGTNGLAGWFADPVGELDLDQADFLFTGSNSQAGGTRMWAGDILDDDGVVDLLTGVGGNLWFVVEDPASVGSMDSLDSYPNRVEQGYEVFVVDINGDGIVDVSVSNWTSELAVYLGGGTSLSSQNDFALRSPDGDGVFSYNVLAHTDGVALDDNTDVGGAVYVLDYFEESDVLLDWRARVRPNDDQLTTLDLLDSADVDGDGDEDLLIRATDGQFSQVHLVWGPLVGEVDLGDDVLHTGYGHVALGDLSGDGRPEIGWSDNNTVVLLEGQRLEGQHLPSNGWQLLGTGDVQAYGPAWSGTHGLVTSGNDLVSGERRVWGWSF